MKIIKITIITLFAISTVFSSCKEDDPYYDSQVEIEKLDAYIAENNITTEPTASGLYYIETLEGSGIQAVAGKKVSVNYKGTFLDGTVFDSNEGKDPFVFTLGTGAVIAGWDEAISYMKKGGKATLIVPSGIAYGAYGSVTIPGYTTLLFEVELLSVF